MSSSLPEVAVQGIREEVVAGKAGVWEGGLEERRDST